MAFALGYYSTSYVIVEHWIDEEPVLTVNEWDEATDEQQLTLSQYYQTEHPRLQEASEQIDVFNLYCAVRGALFLDCIPIDRPLVYTSKTMTLDHGVVVLDLMAITMMALVRPNQTIHTHLAMSPSANISTETPSHENTPSME
ncbi:hypothetical protein ERJ77_25180 [Vibrio anguillarum]|nr:hypothetical protein [Vibrio anguillarum]